MTTLVMKRDKKGRYVSGRKIVRRRKGQLALHFGKKRR